MKFWWRDKSQNRDLTTCRMILVADVIVRSVMAFPLNRRMYSSNFDVNMISNESMLCSFAFTWSQYWQLSFTCIFKSNIILPCIHVQMLCTMLLFLLDLKENCESLYWTEADFFFLSFTQSTHLYFLVSYWKLQYHAFHTAPISLLLCPLPPENINWLQTQIYCKITAALLSNRIYRQ